MRSLLFSACLFLAFSLYRAKPLDILTDGNDSALVDSNVNKAYAPAPFDDLHAAGTGEKRRGSSQEKGGHDEGDGGYYASKSAKKDNGYKHFDSYHKKGGDKYGFESHSTYGKSSGGKKGGSHHTSGSYHSGDGDGGSRHYYYDGEGAGSYHGKANRKAKEPKGSATDGDYYYSNYEADGEGDSDHFSEDGEHYDEDDGHYSEGYEDEESEGYYDGEGEGESEGYYDGEGETRQQKNIVRHGGPSGRATSYSVRHY